LPLLRGELYEEDTGRAAGDASAEQGLQWLVPIGRSGWSIAAGYLGLLSCLPIIGLLLGILALITGILGLRHSSRNPEIGGRGRAIFGIVLGAINIIFNSILIFALVMGGLQSRR
jgi:hypothetical protein